MLKRGDEILIFLFPAIFFAIFTGIVFKLFNLGEVAYGVAEYLTLCLIIFSIYILGYIFLFRKLHKSYLIPFIYMGVIVLVIVITLEWVEKIGQPFIYLVFAIPFYSYSPIRKYLFKRFGFDEEYYNKKE